MYCTSRKNLEHGKAVDYLSTSTRLAAESNVSIQISYEIQKKKNDPLILLYVPQSVNFEHRVSILYGTLSGNVGSTETTKAKITHHCHGHTVVN